MANGRQLGNHLQKKPAELYGSDESRYIERPEEPADKEDHHQMAAWASGCDNALENFNHDAAARG
jgi:hypothetical protein